MKQFHPYFSIVRQWDHDNRKVIGYEIQFRILTNSWEYELHSPIPAKEQLRPGGKLQFAAVLYTIEISKKRTSKQHRQRPTILEGSFPVSKSAFDILHNEDKPYIHLELCDLTGQKECSEGGVNHVSSSSGHHEDDED